MLGLVVSAGCMQTEQQVAGMGVQAAAQASQVAASAVTTTVTGQNPAPRPRQNSGIRFNGRGGFDSSEAQAAALRHAHWIRDHHNQVFRPSWPKPPTSMPAN
jgi:hypothetical protein